MLTRHKVIDIGISYLHFLPVVHSLPVEMVMLTRHKVIDVNISYLYCIPYL